jgi:hypothetical protein
MNKTVRSLLKLYAPEEVRRAIRLRVPFGIIAIPNVAGYFVSALKGDWGGKSIECESDKVAVFRHW